MPRNVRSSFIAVFASNLAVIIAGIATSLLLPKIIGSVTEYGYWQLFFFYSGYYGLFLFGLNDGMNLLLAGKKFTHRDQATTSTIFFYLLCILLAGVTIAAIIGYTFIHDPLYLLIFIAVLVNIIILNITGYTLHINQILLRFKTYAKINTLERVVFAALLIPLWLADARAFAIYIAISTVVRLIVMVYGLYSIKDIWRFEKPLVKNALKARKTIRTYILAGFPLTIGTIFSMLILTSSRIAVEKASTIYNYGLFSFAFAILSIVIMTVSAISTVLYPTLKTVDVSRHARIYSTLRYIVTMLCAISLLGSFLVPFITKAYLPEYASIAAYLFPLLAWVVYQCLGGIVNDTFLRTSRLEWHLLLVNALSFGAIFGLQLLAVTISKDITTMLLIGLAGVMMWFHLTKALILKKNGWSQHFVDYIDIPIVIGFIVISHFDKGLVGFSMYAVLVGSLLIFFRRRNAQIFSRLKFVK